MNKWALLFTGLGGFITILCESKYGYFVIVVIGVCNAFTVCMVAVKGHVNERRAYQTG